MAPPSAQKSFCTSTKTSAACCGSTFSRNVFSIASSFLELVAFLKLPYGFQIMTSRSNGLASFCRARMSRFALRPGKMELGEEFRQVDRRHDFGLGAGVFGDEIVAFLLAGIDEVGGGAVDGALEAAGDVGIGLHPALLREVAGDVHARDVL